MHLKIQKNAEGGFGTTDGKIVNYPVDRYAQPIVERYRCDPDSVRFLSTGPLHPAQGFFRFGDDAICFAECTSGRVRRSANDPLSDVLGEVIVQDSGVLLPFNPAEVIANLREERYRGTRERLNTWAGSQIVSNGYYSLRPLMPVAVRKQLQRIYFRGWRRIPFPAWPVDATVENIHERLLLLALKARDGKPIPFIWFWPDGAPSCTVVTHDVETQRGLDFCSGLMDVNDSFGIKSSFQVIPEERYPVHGSFLAEIRERGFEVNVHDLNHDGHLFRSRTEFLRRAKQINHYVHRFKAAGFRSAIMYRNVSWYDALEISYDMSLPNTAHLDPQRGGCCTVFPFFIGNIVELPVTLTQDYSLFHILGDYSTSLWLDQIQRIRRKHGLISVVVHPDYVLDQKEQRVYRDLLRHLADMRSKGETWIALPNQVAEWWRQRSQLRLVESNRSWRIEGEGKHRAVLAHAVLDAGSLRYELQT